MKTIWKWTLAVTDRQRVELPKNAHILSIQTQGELPQLWAACDPKEPKEPREIVMFGTGHQMPDVPVGRFIDTFQMHGGALVFHAFEVV